jgi:Ser/Thr protein kinase RdoA (MazF antagonist)
LIRGYPVGLAETTLPEGALDALAVWYPGVLGGADPVRLDGGEDSAIYQVGRVVVKVGPSWLTAAAAEWAGRTALRAAGHVPEVIAPLVSSAGRTVHVIGRHPVSVWPFAAGSRASRGNLRHVQAAARLLAQIHVALAGLPAGPRPGDGRARAGTADLADPALDDWLARFGRTRPGRQVLHGDYYPGNLLARDDDLVAVLDWDEAYTGRPESELAVAAWEWGDGLATGQLGRARDFITVYRQAGGTPGDLDETALAQLIRQRLRLEVGYRRAARSDPGFTAADEVYLAAQVAAFRDLAPPHLAT